MFFIKIHLDAAEQVSARFSTFRTKLFARLVRNIVSPSSGCALLLFTYLIYIFNELATNF